MLKSLIVSLACLAPMATWAAGSACDAPLAFRWVPEDAAAPSAGSVHVVDARSGHARSGRARSGHARLRRRVQVLDGLQNYQGDDNGLLARDLNNDGCPDLIVTTDVAPIGNTSSAVYLYDRVRRRLVFSEALSAIGNIAVDSRDPNCVTGDWKGGADNVGGERHCWRKGKLVKTNEYSVRALYDTETGEISCYEHVETTYAGGRKRVHKDCTKTF